MPGSGNQSIAIRLTQCHKSFNITKDDTVLIMWTNISREDRWSTNGWECAGNISSPKHKKLPDIEDLQWYALRDYSTITNTVWLLNHLGCKHEMYSMVPYYQADQYEDGPIYDRGKTISNVFGNELEQIKPSVLDVLYNGIWPQDRRDMHPYPSEHLKYMDLVSSYTPSESARKIAYEQDIWIKDKIESFGNSKKMLGVDELSKIRENKKNHRTAMVGLQHYELVSY